MSRARCPSSPGANPGTKTDAAGDDQAEYVAASRQVRYRVGTGATAATGGILAKTGTTRVRFQVTVDSAAAGTTLTNSANLLYTAATIGTRYTYQTADVTTPVATLANLSLTKTATPATVTAGNTITYTLRTANAGPDRGSGRRHHGHPPDRRHPRLQHSLPRGLHAQRPDPHLRRRHGRERRRRDRHRGGPGARGLDRHRAHERRRGHQLHLRPQHHRQPRLGHDGGHPLGRRRDHQDGEHPRRRCRAPP